MALLDSLFQRRPGLSAKRHTQSVLQRVSRPVRELCYPERNTFRIRGDRSGPRRPAHFDDSTRPGVMGG